MKITSKGQVTIPKWIRDELGLLAGTQVVFGVQDDHATLGAVSGDQSRGEDLVAHLRSHPGDVEMSTDEIMALTRGED